MEQTPKERIIFDEGLYYGDEGDDLAIQSLMASEDLTVSRRPRRSKDSPPRSSTPARNCSTGIRGKTIS